MDVKPGYKMTEVGMIPQDWRIKSIGEIAPLQRGFDLPTNLIVSGHFPIVYSNGVMNYHNKPMVKGPGVITGRSGTLGKVHYIEQDYWPHNTALWVTAFNNNSPRYIFYLYDSIDFERFSSGSGVPTLNRNDAHSFRVPIPPTKAEQGAIAEALSDADNLIETLEQLIAKKRQIKQGAMQELLTGRKRLDGFTEEWATKQIKEFTECTAGGTPSTHIAEYWNGEIRWMNSGELNLKMVAEVEGRITVQGLRNSSTSLVPENCVLIGLAGQGKTRGTVAMNLVPLCTNQSIAAIFPNPDFVTKYLYYNLDSRYDELRELSTGEGGRGGLNLTIIRNLSIPFPSIEEQTAIATVLTDVDNELSSLETKLEKVRGIKRGMMQDLLTGKIRLVDLASNVVSIETTRQSATGKRSGHNEHFDEAVILGVLANRFLVKGSPIGRVRRTKLSYLLHRHKDGEAPGFLKKAAGPYNPSVRYRGAEKIAIDRHYVKAHQAGEMKGFIAGENVAEAERYFENWDRADSLKWLEHFRFKSTEELELLATVDMAMIELQKNDSAISLQSVKDILLENADWKAKLKRDTFSDENILRIIEELKKLFW